MESNIKCVVEKTTNSSSIQSEGDHEEAATATGPSDGQPTEQEHSRVDDLGRLVTALARACANLASRTSINDAKKVVPVIEGKMKELKDLLASGDPIFQHIDYAIFDEPVKNLITFQTTEHPGKTPEQLDMEANDLAEEITGPIAWSLQTARQNEIKILYPPEKKIPVVVITGFLGSGKTTLLNHILSINHGKRIAVIENEFGELGIDDALVRRKFKTDEEIFEMNNGCICCTVRGDLIRILNTLLKEKRDKFDYIIIETTGLAAQTFFVDVKLGWQLRLDGIITVVDCKHILQHLDEKKPEGVENESVEQVAFADRIVLNKTDLVSEEEKNKVIDRIRSINTSVEIIPSVFSVVPIDKVLNIRAFDLSKVLEVDPNFLKDQEHSHDQSVTSVGISHDGDMVKEKVERWLFSVLKEKGTDIFRMKGVLAMKDIPDKFVFQGVHMLFEGEPLDEWKEGEKRTNKIVFIGRNLDRKALTDGFLACAASGK